MERPARMIGNPFEDVGLFVGGVVIDDGMDDFSGRDGALDAVEESNELLVAMPSHAASDHGSVEDVERGEQRRRAVALVVMVIVPHFPGLSGKPGCVGSAWNWLFSSIETTTACLGGSM